MNKLYQISIRSRSGQSRSDWPFDIYCERVCAAFLYYRVVREKFRGALISEPFANPLWGFFENGNAKMSVVLCAFKRGINK